MEEIKKEIIEKVILVAVADQDTTEAEESLDELEELVKTAGAEVAARVISVRSITLVSNASSKLLICAGDNSSSQTIPVASVPYNKALTSSILPFPI